MVIDKIVLKNVQNFDQWDREIDEHFDSQYRRIEMNDVERERIFYQTNDLLMSIANNFFIYGKFKDNWDTSRCYINLFGQNLLSLNDWLLS